MKYIIFILLFLSLISTAGAVQYNETFSDNFDDNTLDDRYTTGYNNVQGTVLEENGILNVSSGKTAAGSQWATFTQSGTYFQTDINVNNTNSLFYSYISLANHADYTTVGDYYNKHLNDSYVVRVVNGKFELYSADGTATLTKLGEITSPNTLNSWTRLYVYYRDGSIHMTTNVSTSTFSYADADFSGFERVMLQSGEYAAYWTVTSYDNLIMGTSELYPNLTPSEVTPVTSSEYREKIFSVTTDRTGDISWYLNGTLLDTDEDVTTSTYTNYSCVIGDWNLSVFATDINGTDSYTWDWTVEELPTIEPTISATPAGNQTIYENIPQTFTVDITNTKGTFAWTLDGDSVESTDTAISSEYTLPAQESGDYVLVCTASNGAGSAVQTWNITYIENSMNLDVVFFDAEATNGTAFIFNVSNFTPGVQAWSPQNFNSTYRGKLYSWNYENLTAIDTKLAWINDQLISFNEIAAPEGVYSITSADGLEYVLTAAFTANNTTGTAPETIQFTDASVGTITSWAWDFDGDGDTDSTEQNPVYVYDSDGDYTVNLTVTNQYMSDSEEKADYIKLTNPYVAPIILTTVAAALLFMRARRRW